MTLTVILVFGFALPLCMLALSIYRDRQRAKLADRLAQAEADRRQREAERKNAAAKRAAQEAEARRLQETEAQKAAKAAERAQKQAEKEQREAAAEERHAATLRRREELHAQKLRQIAELQAAQEKARSEPVENEQPAPAKPEQRKDPQQPTQTAAPAPFAGKTVAFTGKIPGYTHEQAAQAVKLRGGRAFAKGMPAGTTLLVCGQQKGDGDSNKLKRADELIGQIRKISATQFLQIVNTFPV